MRLAVAVREHVINGRIATFPGEDFRFIGSIISLAVPPNAAAARDR
jgi:hypothetical protein